MNNINPPIEPKAEPDAGQVALDLLRRIAEALERAYPPKVTHEHP